MIHIIHENASKQMPALIVVVYGGYSTLAMVLNCTGIALFTFSNHVANWALLCKKNKDKITGLVITATRVPTTKK